MTKACSKCGTERPLEDFYRNPRMRLGRDSWCKPCARAQSAAYNRAHPEQGKAWQRANPDKLAAAQRRWREKNRERIRELETRRDPTERRFREAKRRARLRDVLVEDVQALVVLELDDGVCGICGADVDPFDYHVDHVIPVARGGEHSYSNTQTAHPVCNQRKGAREEIAA